jgi:choline dehydrogenase-like flavoprotein
MMAAIQGTAQDFDIIIVGGGSAGSVLAGRLSEDRQLRVLLLEAGPDDTNPMIAVPKGAGKIVSDPRFCHFFPTERSARFPGAEPDIWLRGKVLGGSSSINGLVYHRGHKGDFERLDELGLTDWGWEKMLPCFRAIENTDLPQASYRGIGGPLHLRHDAPRTRLTAAMIDAAREMGLPFKEDPNQPDALGIAYAGANITPDGKRCSAARAFLPPSVRRRPNLAILTGHLVQRVCFDGCRATGVAVTTQDGEERIFHASRQVLLCAGAVQSPQLLQLSGIGPAALLQELGVPVLVDRPCVGANLREHYLAFLQFRLRHPADSENRGLAGWRLGWNTLRYMLAGRGPLAQAPWHMSAFATVLPDAARPDAQLTFAPFSLDMFAGTGEARLETAPGMQLFGYPSRATSEGRIAAQSRDMRDMPRIESNYLSTEYDRRLSVALVNYIRRFIRAVPLAALVVGETEPTASARSDDEILDFMRLHGRTGFHASGTCRMGIDEAAPLDPMLRVRGVQGLRVIDCSVFPELISTNTNASVIAIAWRAAQLIADELRAPAGHRAAGPACAAPAMSPT